MNRLISITLVLVMAGGLTYNVYQLGYFVVNQEEIVELFCVNKDKPTLKCNGKCHLSEQLLDTKRTTRQPESVVPAPTLVFLLGAPLETQQGIAPNWHAGIKINIRTVQSFLSNFLEIDTPPPQNAA